MKEKSCKNVGFYSIVHKMPDTITQQEIIETLEMMNNNPRIDGILVQLPLPKHIDTTKILEVINPAKDVDGFHPYNMGRIVENLDAFAPCTPVGVMEMFKEYNIAKDLASHTKKADIVIVGVGVPNLIKEDMVKDGAIVIDIGINRLENGKLVGDVDFENVSKKASYITPVPGGVGPMTIAMLLQNTLKAAKRRVK